MNEAWLLSMDGCGGRAGTLLPPAGVWWLGCGRAEPDPPSRELQRRLDPGHPRHPGSCRAASTHGCGVGCHGPARGRSPGPGQGGAELQLGFSVVVVPRCQPHSQDWLGQGRAEEEPGTFSFHTWETVKSQVATPAFVWYFQKNPAGPGILGHNLLWKNKIIKSQSL